MFGPGAFRLLLATAVLVSHVSPGRFGIVAVMVFFILSGYWVTRMYVEKYAPLRNGLPIFYLSRFLRLWPAFVVAILIALILRAVRGEPVTLSQLQVLSMLGVASGVRDPLGISWSLDIEMQFYILLPLLILFAAWLKRPVLILAGSVAVTIAAWGFSYVTKLETALEYLPAFGAGMAIFFARYRPSARVALVSVLVFVIVCALLLSGDQTRALVIEQKFPPRLQRLGSLLWALTLIPFVAWNVQQRGSRLDRHFGDFSYSLYLTHFPVAGTAAWYAGAAGLFPVSLAFAPVCFAAALAFYLLVDRQFERLRLQVIEPRLSPRAAA